MKKSIQFLDIKKFLTPKKYRFTLNKYNFFLDKNHEIGLILIWIFCHQKSMFEYKNEFLISKKYEMNIYHTSYTSKIRFSDF